MEQLTIQQNSTGAELLRLINNFKKDSPTRKDLAYLKARLSTLEDLWTTFEDTDNQIREHPKADQSQPYFAKDYYQSVKSAYEKCQEEINDGIALLTADPGKADPEVKTSADDEVKGVIRRQGAAIKSLQSLLAALTIDQQMTSEYRAVKSRAIDRLWTQIESLNDSVWGLAEQPATFGYEFDEYLQLQEEVQQALVQLTEIQGRSVTTTTPTQASNSMMKLPKIVLPKFDGDYLKWQQFYDLFSQMVHNQPMGNCQKMWYLKTHLSGEAERLIRHLSLSDVNYETAWSMLTDRYGNKRLLVTTLLNKLLSQSAISAEGASAIKALHDTTKESLLGLENLGVPTKNWDPILLHVLLRKLDKTTHGLYEQQVKSPRDLQTFSDFLKFLENRFQALEALGTKARTPAEHNKWGPPAKSLATTATGACAACDGSHQTYVCPKFRQLSAENRLSIIQKNNACRNCLRSGHPTSKCWSRGCAKCSKKHHTLVHLDNKPLKEASATSSSSATEHKGASTKGASTSQAAASKSTSDESEGKSITLSAHKTQINKGYVILSTAVVRIANHEGKLIECRAILDSGSQLNFITEKLAKELGLQQTSDSLYIHGIGQSKQRSHGRVNVSLNSTISGFSTRLEAFVLPKITSHQPTQPLDFAQWPIPSNIKLADPHFDQPACVDFLIGAEIYHQLMSIGQIKMGTDLPILQNTVLGWIVSGKVNNMQQSELTCGVCSEDERLDQQIEKFWTLEENDTPRQVLTSSEKRVEHHFDQTSRRNPEGRFIVNLPFLEEVNHLGASEDIALQRFLSLERKLQRQPELKVQYVNFMQEYADLRHMEGVDFKTIKNQPHYFLPHHGVIKPDSSTTKLRVVFDASAKTSKNVSLNDILGTGPTIQDDLFSILLRFRMPRFVFTADIEKMYRQILVDAQDRKYQLILWRSEPSERIKCYQLCTVTYGTTSAPYLATKCLQKLAEEEADKYPLGSKALKNDFYVDDVMTGSDSLATAIEMQAQLDTLLRTAGFKLRKWCSNHPRLLQGIPQEDVELQLEFDDIEDQQVKTLGLIWQPKSDNFCIKIGLMDRRSITKRTVSSDIARLFDPLGIMAPVIIVAKLFLQELWLIKLDWDASMPQEMHTRWLRYREELMKLDKIQYPRHIFAHQTSKFIQMHTFADASEKAYGAVVYIRSINKDNIPTVRILCAKSKVAPTKKSTLPRLELCAAKLAVELSARVKKSLQISNNDCYFWTDSEIVLAWINAPSSSFHTFVANRIAAIQDLSVPSQWRHVSSKQNPADVLSRGINPDKLKDCNIWFYGPPFLHGAESSWPSAYTPKKELEVEKRRTIASLAATDGSSYITEQINHQNSFKRLRRVIAYMLRFAQRARGGSTQTTANSTALSASELNEALIVAVKEVQQQEFKEDLAHLKKYGEVSNKSCLLTLAPFLDERGLLRVGGRLEASSLSYDAKHPILLPYSHVITRLIMQDIHRDNLHTGPQSLLAIVRQRFWPIKGKILARSIVQQCVKCTRVKPQLLSQVMGNLPAARVQPARPFINTGVDFCGPIWTHYKVRGKRPQKSYVAVFCCFATKAIHLEVVSDLSTNGFIGALKRFIGRRGHCRNLYCDNATNFVGARNQLSELQNAIHSDKSKNEITALCETKGLEFHFIPPSAPHFGGLWEAAVKSAKYLLQRSVAGASLTYEELETVMIEIEAVLNSRPLTQMSSNPNDLSALTPGHFLIGEPLTSSVHPEAEPMKASLLTRWKLVSHIKNEFWRRWSKEYLNELQQRYKWKSKGQNLEVGTLVIIKDDNLPPMKWPLGRVVEIFKGNDGVVRVAAVRTSTNVIRRPIHKLAPLPVDIEPSSQGSNQNEGADDADDLETQKSQVTSRKHGKQNGQEAARPSKRIRRSIGATLTTLLLTCLLLPISKASSIQINEFEPKPGLHFDNIGIVNTMASQWKLVVYYDMQAYWNEVDAFVNGSRTLQAICALIPQRALCSRTIAQFQHVTNELSRENELLQPQPRNHKVKRGALNIVGNVANALFGVLDDKYAEQISKTIDKVESNENHLLDLMRNQTSIIDSTINVIKKGQRAISTQFLELKTHIDQLTDRTNNITRDKDIQTLSELFTSVSIQLIIVSTNLQRAQAAILDVMLDTHHGKISPLLLSPEQLQQALTKVKGHLPPTLKLPVAPNETARLYNLMTVQGRLATKHAIFKIEIPLLEVEDYELFRVIPIPASINGTFMAIKSSSDLLAINYHRDQYFPLSELEVKSCLSIAQHKYMCEPKHPIHRKGSVVNACEIQLINQLTPARSCHIIRSEGKPQWLQLNDPNKWIYALNDTTVINTVCDTEVSQLTLRGSGLLTINGSCIIKQEHVTIQRQTNYPSITRASYTKSGDVAEFIRPRFYAALQHTDSHFEPMLEELEALQKDIIAQGIKEIPNMLHPHDIHQFAIGYLGLAAAVAIISYLAWRFFLSKRKQKPVPPPRRRTSDMFKVDVG